MTAVTALHFPWEDDEAEASENTSLLVTIGGRDSFKEFAAKLRPVWHCPAIVPVYDAACLVAESMLFDVCCIATPLTAEAAQQA